MAVLERSTLSALNQFQSHPYLQCWNTKQIKLFANKTAKSEAKAMENIFKRIGLFRNPCSHVRNSDETF